MQNELFQANVDFINTQFAILADHYAVLAAMGQLVSRFYH
jgi:outer membrane protein TolC